MQKIQIRNETDYVSLEVDASSQTDSYWVDYIVEIKSGPFSGRYGSQLPLNDLRDFGKELKELSDKLSGTISFDDLEGCFSLEMKGDGRGHIYVSGKATDLPGVGHYLRYAFSTDQTFLPEVISAFSKI